MIDHVDNIIDLNAILHPGSVYDHPHDVLADLSISIGEKRAILASWASDAMAVTSNTALRELPGSHHKVTIDEILEALKNNLKSQFKPRTTRMKSTSISLDHPLVKAGLALGRGYYGSPTTSDKALMPFPTLKMGPGDSARSHTADEYIYIDEIRNGMETYIQLLDEFI